MNFNFNAIYKQPTKKLLTEAFDFNGIEDEEEDFTSKSIKDTMSDVFMGDAYLLYLSKNSPFDLKYQFETNGFDNVEDVNIVKDPKADFSKYNNITALKVKDNIIQLYVYNPNRTCSEQTISYFMATYGCTIQYLANILLTDTIKVNTVGLDNGRRLPLPFFFQNIKDMTYWFNKCEGINQMKFMNDDIARPANIIPYDGSAYVIFECNSYDEYIQGVNLIKSAKFFSTCNMVTILPVINESNTTICLTKSAIPYICKEIFGNKNPEDHFAQRHIKQFSEDYILRKYQSMLKNTVMNPVNMYNQASTPSSKLLYAAWAAYNANTIIMAASTKLEEIYNDKFDEFIKMLPIPAKQIETGVILCLRHLFSTVKATSEDFAAMYLYLSDILDRAQI